MAFQATSNFIIPGQATLELIPISGNGQKKPLSEMQKIFNDYIPPDDQERLKIELNNSKQHASFILRDKDIDKAVGVLVYQRQLSEKFSTEKLTKCLKVDVLYISEQSYNQSKVYHNFILNKIINVAIRIKAGSIVIELAKQCKQSISFLQKNDFSLFLNEDSEKFCFLGLSIKPTSKAIPNKESGDLTKKRTKSQQDELESSSPLENNQFEKGEFLEATKKLKADPSTQPNQALASPKDSLCFLYPNPKKISYPINVERFHLIIEYQKAILGKLYSGIFATLKAGDQIKFDSCMEANVFHIAKLLNYPSIEAKVFHIAKLVNYPSFEEMLKHETPNDCLQLLEDQFVDKAELKKCGVIAIYLDHYVAKKWLDSSLGHV